MSDPASQTLSGRVARALHRRGARGGAATVQMLCSPGLGPSGIYFLSDMIIDAHPDRLVFGINLRGFNRGSLHDFGYGEVAGWVGAKRLFEAARLPLFAVGVTFDRLLLYNAIVAAGGAELWLHVRQLQSRTARAYTPAGKWIDELFGSTGQADMQFSLGIARMTRTQLADGKRQSRQQAEHTFGPVLGGLSTDEPSLHILVGALRRFRQAGIPTLVYVQPTNFEHLHVLGLNTAGFERSVAVIQETVQREGAQFADFHALFPDGGFRDAGDHYTFDGKPNGTAWLGDRIAYAISQGWLTGKLPPEADHALQ